MEAQKTMYPVLDSLMKSEKIQNEHIAICIRKNVKTVENKMRGVTPWGFDECVAIHTTYFPRTPILELFKKRNA